MSPVADRWELTLAGLRGERWPVPPDLPGRVICAFDRPLTVDELAGVETPSELAACTGVSHQCAALRFAAYRRTGEPARLLGRASPTAAATAAAST